MLDEAGPLRRSPINIRSSKNERPWTLRIKVYLPKELDDPTFALMRF
jgi:hypothetical protein